MPCSVSPWWRALALGVVLLAPGALRAQTNYAWNVGNGNWGTAGSWTPGGGPPGAPDSATFNIAGTYTATLNDNRSINNVTLNNGTATISHITGTLTVGGTVALTAGSYSLQGGTISGGSITSAGGLLRLQNSNGNILSNVAVGAGVLDLSAADGRVRLQGTTTLAAGTILNLSTFGGNGNIVAFEQTVTANSLTVNLTAIGALVSIEGNNTLTLGPATTVTHSSTGTSAILSGVFSVGGTPTVLNQGLIRNTAGGILNISPSVFRNQSGGILRSTAGTINLQRGGVINQSGGTFDVNGGTLSLNGPNWDNDGTITLSSGTLNLGGTFATAGIGTLNRTGGTVQITGALDNAGATLALTAATGSYQLAAGTVTGGSITAAGGSALQLQFSNANRLNNVAVGPGVLDFSAPDARVRLQGTTSLAAGTIDLPGGGSALGTILAFEQTTTLNGLTVNLIGQNSFLSVEGNNTLTFGPTTTVTHSSAGTGIIRSDIFLGGDSAVINQGLIRNTGGALRIASDAFTNQVGGTVRAEGGTVAIAAATNLTNFAGTTLTGGTWEVRGSATLDFENRNISTLAAGTTVVFDGPSPTFLALNTLTTNNGTLRVLGGNTFTPTAASINNAGALEVGAASTFGKGVVVKSGGTLLGAGAVSGAVTAESGGTVAPGSGPAVLTVNGNVALQSGSALVVELNGTAFGTQHDRLTVNGTVDLTGATLTATLGYAAAGTDRLFVLANDGNDPIAGAFAGLPDGSAVFLGALKVDISYFGDSVNLTATGGNDVVLYNFRPVPEPASVLAVAGLALAALGRRRNRRSAPATSGHAPTSPARRRSGRP